MKKLLKRKIIFVPLLTVVLLMVMGVTLGSACPLPSKVDLCHADPPDTAANGWNEITVATSAVLQQGHDGHAADIIPAFSGYPGKNMTTLFGWGVSGAEILANGCILPPEPFTPPDPITQTIYDADCEDIMAQDQEAVWVGGEDGEYGPWVNVGSSYQVWVWGDPYTLESWTAPDQSVIDEPTECQVAHIASTFLNNDCDGWEVGYMFDGVKNVVDSGIWNDPVAYEDATFSSFVIPVPAGEIVDTTDALGLLAGGTVEEPASCPNYWLKTEVKVDCEGWRLWMWIMDGDSVAHGPMASNNTADGERGYWTDPYRIESYDPITNIALNYPGYPYLTAPDLPGGSEPEYCQVPHIASTFLNNDCDGWEVGYMFDGVKNVVDSGIWNDPVAYEDATFSSFVIPVPAGEIVDTTDALGLLAGGTVEEPARCHNFSLDDGQDADCDGWWRYVDLLDDGVFVKQLLDLSDSWSDIYTTEMLPGTTFFVPDAYGPDVVFSDLYEPTDCLILKTYKHHQAYLENNCEGIKRVVNLYEGPASDPYQTLVGTHYNVTTLFTDPFSYETVPAQFVDIPDAYGPDYTFPAMIEPEVCHSFRLSRDQGVDCDGYWRYVVLVDGGKGVKTLHFDEGLWLDEFVLEPGLPEVTLTFPAEYPPGQVSFLALPEPTECQSTHETDVWSDSDCFEYSGGYWFDGEKFTTFSGAWLNLYGPESITETVIVPIPEGELGKKLFEVTIAKDMECLQCKTTIAYYQAMVRPTSGDVPPNYMTLPFNNGAFCAVITPKGTVPADDRITSVCSLCPEKYPDGYVFTGTATEADVAAVYKVECYGEGVTYFWFDKEWKWGAEYDPMYNIYGRELSCPRIDGCIDWIKENAPEGIYPVLEE